MPFLFWPLPRNIKSCQPFYRVARFLISIRIQVDDIANHLNRIAIRENIAVDRDGLHIIAQKADGGLRDALSMFDQIVSYTNKNVTYKAVIDNLNILDYDYYFRLTDDLTTGDVSKALLLFNEILNNGFDGNNFINGLASHFRNLLVAKDAQTVQLLEVSENIKLKYLSQSKETDLAFLLTALNLANQCDLVYKNSKNQRLQVELSLIKMCHIPSVIKLADFSQRNSSDASSNSNTATGLDQDKKKTLVNKGEDENGVQNPIAIESGSPEVPEEAESIGAESTKFPEGNPMGKVENASIEDLEDFIAQEDLQDLPDHLAIPLPTEAPEVASKIANPASHSQKDHYVTTGSIKIQPVNGNVTSSIPSLTDLERVAQGEEEKGPQYISGDEKQEFTPEQFMELWKVYTQKANDGHKIHLYTLMNNEPILEGTTITVLVENSALESTLQNEKVELLNFLRSALRNFDLQIVAKRAANTQKKRIYTNKDKYTYLVDKNPQLEEMRKRFNLDVNP